MAMSPISVLIVLSRRLTKRASPEQPLQTQLAPSYPPLFLPLLGGDFQGLGTQAMHLVAELKLRLAEQLAVSLGRQEAGHSQTFLLNQRPHPLENPLCFRSL